MMYVLYCIELHLVLSFVALKGDHFLVAGGRGLENVDLCCEKTRSISTARSMISF